MSARGGDGSTPRQDTRAEIAESLYPGSGPAVAARLEEIAQRGAPAHPVDPVDGADVWLIAYPDQFGADRGTPLATLGEVLDEHLDDWVTGIHVLPLHPASSDGGFAVEDHDRVDPALGDWDDVARLARGRRLMLDLVCNHTSRSHRWFEAFTRGEGHDRWYRMREEGEDLTEVVRPREGPPVTSIEVAGRQREVWTTFSPDQVDLDYRNPDVLAAMTEVLFALIARGAQVIRLDAVAYCAKPTQGPRVDEEDGHRLVALWRSLVDAHAPGVLLVTETNLPEHQNRSYLGSSSRPEAHGIYRFGLPPLVLDALATGEADRLAAHLDVPLESPGLRLNFLGSHDGVGLRPAEGLLEDDRIDALADAATRAGLGVNRFAAVDGASRPYELTGTWLDLVEAIVGPAHALDAHVVSHALLLALDGVPVVYTHALLASRSDHVAASRSGASRDLNRARLRRDEIERMLVSDPGSGARRSVDALAAMARRRRDTPAFAPDAHQEVAAAGGALTVLREGADGSRAVVEVNLSPDVADIVLPPGRWRRPDGGATHAPLGGYQSRWLIAE